MVEVPGVPCLVPDKVGIAIVGNVLGTNDGVVVSATTEELVVSVVGSIFSVCTKSHVSGGAFFVPTGTGLAFVM